MIIFIYNNNALILTQFKIIMRKRDISHLIFKKNEEYLTPFLRNPAPTSGREKTFFPPPYPASLRSV